MFARTPGAERSAKAMKLIEKSKEERDDLESSRSDSKA